MAEAPPGSHSVAETLDLEQHPIVAKLRGWDAQAVAEVHDFRGELTIVVPRGHLRRVAELLCDEPGLEFALLSDITDVDRYPAEPRFELNYHLVSISRRERIRIKVRLPGVNPSVESVTSVWPGANWHKREVFDFFGVRFEGHPDLRRLLLPEDWEGYPLRKDYPVEGYR
jgi:NADH-quinone oxidoreductase subunit C